MIVDVHMHAHTDIRFASTYSGDTAQARERFKPEGYIASKGDVDIGIVYGMNFPALGMEVPNENVAEVVRQYPGKLAGFCSVMPTAPSAVEELEHSVKDLGLIGLKLSPIYQYFYPNDPKVFPLYKKAQQLGIPVAFHTSYAPMSRARLVYGDVRLLDDVAIEFPDLKIIICHFGYTQYTDTVNLVKKHPNVFTDVSYICHLANFPKHPPGRLAHPSVEYPYFHFIQPLLYNFSMPGDQDKILFGSDYPGSTASLTLQALRELPWVLKEMRLPEIPQERIEKIIGENWKRVFQVKDGRLSPV